jgi:acetyltransferase-like isoleucine patch superfamily enzyme
MPWTRAAALSDEHRARLIAAGVDGEILAATPLRLVSDPLPEWWHEQGNALYLGDDVDPADLPRKLIDTLAYYSFSDVLLVAASPCNNMASLLVGGDGATVFLGPRSAFTATEIYCGAHSTVVLSAEVVATRCAIVDARNGGSIVAEPDQLWAANVYVATDDMHRLEDAETGARLNPYGAQIRLGSHVWLGREAIVTGHCEIGEGAVVGSRAMVRGQKVPPRTAVAGCPARVIREGVTWRGEDTP